MAQQGSFPGFDGKDSTSFWGWLPACLRFDSMNVHKFDLTSSLVQGFSLLVGKRSVLNCPDCHSVSFMSSTHTHTHTHTHVGFYGLQGLSIGVMVFILYKLYVLLPYTYPTPKLSPHRRRCISIFPQKNSLCMIYKRFKLWGHWKCPHKSPSPCNTYVIPMSLYKFVSS